VRRSKQGSQRNEAVLPMAGVRRGMAVDIKQGAKCRCRGWRHEAEIKRS